MIIVYNYLSYKIKNVGRRQVGQKTKQNWVKDFYFLFFINPRTEFCNIATFGCDFIRPPFFFLSIFDFVHYCFTFALLLEMESIRSPFPFFTFSPLFSNVAFPSLRLVSSSPFFLSIFLITICFHYVFLYWFLLRQNSCHYLQLTDFNLYDLVVLFNCV